MRLHRLLFMMAAANTVLGACAHGGAAEDTAAAPSFAPIAVERAPQAKPLADCIGEAARAGTFGRAHDASTELLVFTCTGVTAEGYYDSLANRAQELGSEVRDGTGTIRSSEKINKDLFGADHCVREGDGRTTCHVFLNVGDYLKPVGKPSKS